MFDIGYNDGGGCIENKHGSYPDVAALLYTINQLSDYPDVFEGLSFKQRKGRKGKNKDYYLRKLIEEYGGKVVVIPEGWKEREGYLPIYVNWDIFDSLRRFGYIHEDGTLRSDDKTMRSISDELVIMMSYGETRNKPVFFTVKEGVLVIGNRNEGAVSLPEVRRSSSSFWLAKPHSLEEEIGENDIIKRLFPDKDWRGKKLVGHIITSESIKSVKGERVEDLRDPEREITRVYCGGCEYSVKVDAICDSCGSKFPLWLYI